MDLVGDDCVAVGVGVEEGGGLVVESLLKILSQSPRQNLHPLYWTLHHAKNKTESLCCPLSIDVILGVFGPGLLGFVGGADEVLEGFFEWVGVHFMVG